jgi:hypothetical protein
MPKPIDPDSHRQAIVPVQQSIENCVRDGVRRDSKLWGRLALQLQIDGHGRVVAAAEYNSHFPDLAVVECSTLVARDLRLPDPTEPGSIVLALKVGTLPPLVAESSGTHHAEPLANLLSPVE